MTVFTDDRVAPEKAIPVCPALQNSREHCGDGMKEKGSRIHITTGRNTLSGDLEMLLYPE